MAYHKALDTSETSPLLIPMGEEETIDRQIIAETHIFVGTSLSRASLSIREIEELQDSDFAGFSGVTGDTGFEVYFNGATVSQIYIDDYADEGTYEWAEYMSDFSLSQATTKQQMARKFYDGDISSVHMGNIFVPRTINGIDDLVAYGDELYWPWIEISDNTIVGLMPLSMIGRDLYPMSLMCDGKNDFCPFEGVLFGNDFSYFGRRSTKGALVLVCCK